VLPAGMRTWSTGSVTVSGPSLRPAFRVCLLAADQLSVDDRRCRSCARPLTPR
jgi:hypothetical protein